MGKYTNRLNKRLKIAKSKTYHRHEYQSFMTVPEWFNVDLSENFAKHLARKESMFQIPYFYQIYQLWRNFFLTCWYSAKETHSYSWLFSDYMLMDIFVVLFTTAELVPKALISCVLAPFLSKENDTQMQAHLAEYYEKFVREIETTAFFNHDYATNIQELKQFWASIPKENRTWIDYFTWSCVLNELRVKGFVSSFLKSGYEETDTGKTDILVKFRAVSAQSPEEAMAAFNEKLASIQEKTPLKIADEDIYCKKFAKNKNGENYFQVYARLEAPHYLTFKESIQNLAEEGIYLRKIAGQDYVMVRCEIDTDSDRAFKDVQENLSRIVGISPMYCYKDGSLKGHGFSLFKVPTKALHEKINEIEEKATIKLIHNF